MMGGARPGGVSLQIQTIIPTLWLVSSHCADLWEHNHLNAFDWNPGGHRFSQGVTIMAAKEGVPKNLADTIVLTLLNWTRVDIRFYKRGPEFACTGGSKSVIESPQTWLLNPLCLCGFPGTLWIARACSDRLWSGMLLKILTLWCIQKSRYDSLWILYK